MRQKWVIRLQHSLRLCIIPGTVRAIRNGDSALARAMNDIARLC
jgi:hypothetical protein